MDGFWLIKFTPYEEQLYSIEAGWELIFNNWALFRTQNKWQGYLVAMRAYTF